MRKNILVIIGESGCGKTTLAKELCKLHDNIELLVTCTSRPQRANEVDEVDYSFLTKQDFEELIKAQRFVEYAVFRDWYYGLNKQTIYNSSSKNMLVVLSPVGLKNLVNCLDKSKYNVIPVYVYTSECVRLHRSLDRDPDVDEVYRRLSADRVDFENITSYILENNGYIITNNKSIELAIGQLEYVVEMSLGDING